MENCEAITSSTHSFAYSYRLVKKFNVSWKFAKLQRVITSLFFNQFSPGLQYFVQFFYSFFWDWVKPVLDFLFNRICFFNLFFIFLFFINQTFKYCSDNTRASIKTTNPGRSRSGCGVACTYNFAPPLLENPGSAPGVERWIKWKTIKCKSMHRNWRKRRWAIMYRTSPGAAPRGKGGAGGSCPPYDFFFLVSSVGHVHGDNTPIAHMI